MDLCAVSVLHFNTNYDRSPTVPPPMQMLEVTYLAGMMIPKHRQGR